MNASEARRVTRFTMRKNVSGRRVRAGFCMLLTCGDNSIADREFAIVQDLRVEAAAMHKAGQHRGRGEARQMGAGLTQAQAAHGDCANLEFATDQIIEAYAAS